MSIEIRALRSDELEVHGRLIYESYLENATDDSDGLADPQWWVRSVANDPYYAPEQTRVLLVDGRMVASVSNFARQMFCGPDAPLAKVSAIGSVATHPDFRRRGYVRQLLTESRQWMLENGFDFCFLFGNEQVYGSSGWRLLSSFEATVSVRPPQDDPGLAVRQADFERDIPALCGIYDDFCQALTGPFVRTRAYWERRVRGGYFRDRTPEFRVLEEGGEPVGYYRSSMPGRVEEIGWRRSTGNLAARVIGTILRQWPDQDEVHFAFWNPPLREALDRFIWADSQSALQDRQSTIRLTEAYRGLWTYIGPGSGAFRHITDTQSLLAWLRSRDYTFWSGVDSF